MAINLSIIFELMHATMKQNKKLCTTIIRYNVVNDQWSLWPTRHDVVNGFWLPTEYPQMRRADTPNVTFQLC